MSPIAIGPTERLKTTLVPTLGVLNPLRLDLGTTYQALRFRLTGNLVITVAGTVYEDAPLGLVKTLDLLVGGGQPMRSMDARAMFRLNHIQHGTQPRITTPAGGVGTQAFAAEWYLDMWQPDLGGGLARAFWLDADFLSSIAANFQIGDVADIFSGTATITNPQIGVDVVEVLDFGGPLSRMQILRQVVQQIAATGIKDIDPFTGGGVNYRGFLIHATSGNADPNRASGDDTIISDVLLSVPSRRITDAIPWERLRAETKRVYSMESVAAGWGLIDFAKEHHLADVLDTSGEQNVSMRLTIAAAPANAIVQVYPIVFQRRQIQGRPGVLPLPVRKIRTAA